MTSPAETLPVPRKKPYLEEAISVLAALDQQLQDGEDPTNALVTLFNQAKVDIAEGIDRRKGYARYFQMTIVAAKAEIQDLKAWVEKLESRLELLKSNTMEAMKALPGFTFKDTSGRKLWVQKSTPSLKTKLNLRESAVRNIVDHQEVEFLGLPSKYLKPVSYLCLDSEAVRADLKAGVKLEWAELVSGQHVRGLLAKEEREGRDDEG